MAQKKKRSIRFAAGIIGKHHAQVAAWAKREDWPFPPPPWSDGVISQIADWAAANIGTKGKAPPEFQRARLLRMLADCQLLEAQNAVARGDLIDSAAWKDVCHSAIAAAKQVMANLGNTLQPLISVARAKPKHDGTPVDLASIIAPHVSRITSAYEHAMRSFQPGATNGRDSQQDRSVGRKDKTGNRKSGAKSRGKKKATRHPRGKKRHRR